MGCANCSSNTADGLPKGCKNNGSCSNGGCNKLPVFDWLSNMQLPESQRVYDIVEVRFKNGRKSFYRNFHDLTLQPGDVVATEGSPGHDVGIVTLTGELVKLQVERKNFRVDNDMRKVLRKASQKDIDTWQIARGQEDQTMLRSREIAITLGLKMKISDVEYQGDRSKATFYYTAEERVDFRELIKKLADEFKIRIEMRQIGARQEAARVGGIGSCGRELCCTTWLHDFRTVSTNAARYQQLSINPQKLAGQCGKLKCCLNYELDSYMEAFKEFPNTELKLRTKAGEAVHFKTDIFKRLMWYVPKTEKGGFNPIALSLDRVLEIVEMNKRGKEPEDLKDFAQVFEVEKAPGYDNVVGQDSLTRFDRKKGARKSGRGRRKPEGRANDNRQQAGGAKQERSGNPRSKNQGNRNKPKGENPNQNQGQGTDKQAAAKKEGSNNNRNRNRNNRNRNNRGKQGGGNSNQSQKSE